MARELMPKSGIMMPYVVVTRDAAVVGVSTVDGVAGEINLTNKYLQITNAANTYLNKTDGATKTFVMDAISPIMEGALFKADPYVANDVPFRSAGANGVESVEMIKVDTSNRIKVGSYESNVQGVEFHSTGNLNVVDLNISGVETRYPIYTARHRPPISDLPFAAIGSYITDSQGRTIGVNRTGINSDIKQLTQKITFTQPPTVPDGVSDYDAVNVRQLRNAGGGSGATLNGVMNFGVGLATLWQSRAFIPNYSVPADGQLLNRTDWPELWAHAQMHTPIDDADWLADPTKRCNYSNGDGATTFRVPDMNGVQDGSIWGLYGRGDAGGRYVVGSVLENGSPDIVGVIGQIGSVPNLNYPLPIVTTQGAFRQPSGRGNPRSIGTATSAQQATTLGAETVEFKASYSNAAYGRASEVRPNSFVGVWIIRASGGFTAANTSWSVINADETTPPSNILVNGGRAISTYKTDDGIQIDASFRVSKTIGQTSSYSVIKTSDSSTSSAEFFFGSNGSFIMPNNGIIATNPSAGSIRYEHTVRAKNIVTDSGDGVVISATEANQLTLNTAPAGQTVGNYVNIIQGKWYAGNWTLGGVRGSSQDMLRAQLNVTGGSSGLNASYMFGADGVGRAAQWLSTSDSEVKNLHGRVTDIWDKFDKIEGVTWNYKFGNESYGVGFIAQDVIKAFPELENRNPEDMVMNDGTVVKTPLNIDAGSVAAALHHEAIRLLRQEIEDLRQEVKALKENIQ